MLNIQQNIPLAPFTAFKIGGPAKFFTEADSEETLLEALDYARKNNLEIFMLGGGSNILVSDNGFDGLVIKILGSRSPIGLREPNKIECWIGDSLSDVVKFSAENNLSGLEWAAGIPGTIGGAIRGNAGAFGADMSGIVESMKVYCHSREGGNPVIKIFKNKDCKFSYRDSIFKQNKNLIILSCVLKFQKGDKNEIEKKIKETIKKRTEKQPQGMASAGSFFQNPVVEDKELIKQFEKDTGLKIKNDKIPAGWLVEEVGLLGKKIGDAMVSEKHGNFVLNLGNATAQDVVMLASLIKMKVRDELGVQLKEEIQYVGF